jgi:GT2 family glycosyltransferase
VSFIVPVRNDAEGLRRCLASIRRQRDDLEVIVADNGSVDASREVAARAAAIVLQCPRDTVAVLRNRAAMAATGEFLAFIDADIELAPGWLDRALAYFSNPAVGAVGAEYCAPPGANWLQRLYDAMREHVPGTHEARWLPSGNMVVRRRSFQQIDGFEEGLRTCEDVAFCQSLKDAGFRVLTDSTLQSAHFGDPSTLGLLFRGETWRARDNLRVSLRRISSWKDLPSIFVPPLWLASAAFALGAAIAGFWRPGMLLPGAISAVVVCGLSALRALRIWRRIAAPRRRMLLPACAVAVVYDAARAVALLVTVPHRRATVSASPAGERV